MSAVASRLGVWGEHAGHPQEAFAAFGAYVRELNPWLPAGLVRPVSAAVTACEASLGLVLLGGVWTRRSALAAAGLLMIFAAAMTAFTGVKSALDYSVWTAAAGAFLLAVEDPALSPPLRR